LTVNFLYIFFPIADLWPVSILPGRPDPQRARRVNFVPAVICAVLLALNLGVLARSHQIATSWQRPLSAATQPPCGFRCGVVLRVPSDPFPTREHFQSEAERLRDLGATAVNLFVHDNLCANPLQADRLADFLDQLRQDGMSVILTADYPQQWATRPPGTPEEVQAAMLPFQRFLAARYGPDILVPFIEPYGAAVVMTGRSFPPEQWEDLLAKAADAVRAANPQVRCAVYLGHATQDRILYERVCAAGSPVQVVGFSFYSLFQTRQEMDTVLQEVARWIEQYGQGREHWIFEFGQSPLTMGGELAQANYIQCVATWAMRQVEMQGVCVFALGDYAEKMGLLNSMGRRRPAFRSYQRLMSGNPRSEQERRPVKEEE
jgi:hypothetical protein